MSTTVTSERKATPSFAPARLLTPARAPLLQRAACSCGRPVLEGGECAECRRKRIQRLQRSASGETASMNTPPPSVNSVLRSTGEPLDAGTRSDMESRFGHDFSRVRVHADVAAAESARDVSARAYTVGQDVVFGRGEYDPHSAGGRKLLAHELAHTVQQSGLQRSSESINVDQGAEYQRLESEAESAAAAALHGGPVNGVRRASRTTLSRAGGGGGKTVPSKSKKPKKVKSDFGSHTVTPSENFESDLGKVEEFDVNLLYVPAEKGQTAFEEYERIAGGKLETVIQLTGTGRAKTALWQTRPSTDQLRKLWLEKVGWSADARDDLWKRAGGDAEFPKVGGGVCQMDHSIELQVGGDNTPANIQPLNAGPNQASGRDINKQLGQIVTAITEDAALTSEETTQYKLRFAKTQAAGKLDTPPGICPPTKRSTCLDVEHCAKKLKVEKDERGNVSIARDDYPISAGGGSPRNLRVPVTFKTVKSEAVPVEGDAVNGSISTLIPGLLLTRLAHKTGAKPAGDFVEARIDTRPETRLPLSLDPNAKPVNLDVTSGGLLKLRPADAKGGIGFTYKYLSPGAITSLVPNESGGVDWTGYIKTSVPLLGQLDVAYKGGELTLKKDLGLADLKPPFKGVRITESSVGLKLSPEFKPEGKLKLEFGPEGKPLADAVLTASSDGKGFVATGLLRVLIPGVDKAEAEVTYKGGGEYGAGLWTGVIVIESTQIKLPYVSGGSVVVRLAPGTGVMVDGKLNLSLPGENSAMVGVRKEESAWILSGGGRFKVPKIGPVNAAVRYNTASRLLIASAKDVSFEIFGLTAKLRELTAEVKPDGVPVFYGSGGVEIKKGKANGKADLTLNRNGKITGKGSVTYQFNDKLSATANVELDDKERLKFSGQLVLAYLKLFDAFGDKKNLFDLSLSIPIPGASIGDVGLEVRIGGGADASYSIGPGSIGPVTFTADFYPLEENSNLTLGVEGVASIPASARLTAYIKGGIVLDAFIAEVGGELILEGWIELKGGLFAKFSATYSQGKLAAKLTPEIKATLLLGLALKLRAWAKAGIGWLSVKTEKTWTLGKREVDTRLGFSLKAPLEYSTDKGPTFPSVDQIEMKKPDITAENMKRIVRELVSGTTPSEREV